MERFARCGLVSHQFLQEQGQDKVGFDRAVHWESYARPEHDHSICRALVEKITMNARDNTAAAQDLGSYLGSNKTVSAMRKFHPDLIKIRHAIHQNPELGFEEFETAKLVVRELETYGVDEIHTKIGVTGVVAVIKGKHEVKTGQHSSIGLRADMDALPMQEENEFSHRSTKSGLMHGCGHDGHVTMLLGAARHLAATRDFAGTVNLIFQPGEEGFAGAKAMIEDGLFTRFPCDAVFAMHNWPGLEVGKISVAPGPMMAAADRVEIVIEGTGGHGAHAYQAIDPIVVAAHVITAAQSIVSRNVPPLEAAVLSLCGIEAGDLKAMSVIPPRANIVGTVRTFNENIQAKVEKRLTEVVESVADGFGAKGTVNYERIYPATVNTEAEAQFSAQVAASLVGDENVLADLPPSMGAEDFSFMLKSCPGAYLRIGQGGGPGGCFLHNTRYDFNDDIIPLGSSLLINLAENWLPNQ
jgi:hippurate hydrolase